MRKKFDFLVIGSGIAGLSYALKVAQHGKVCIVTKSGAADTATRYAQGGIAAVTYTPDTYEKHIKDTLIAGDDLNDENIVRITITESSQRIKELIEWGTRFDKTTTGQFDLGREVATARNACCITKTAPDWKYSRCCCTRRAAVLTSKFTKTTSPSTSSPSIT